MAAAAAAGNSSTAFVVGLPSTLCDAELRALFAPLVRVVSIVPYNAYVQVNSDDAFVFTALFNGLDGVRMYGQTIRVCQSRAMANSFGAASVPAFSMYDRVSVDGKEGRITDVPGDHDNDTYEVTFDREPDGAQMTVVRRAHQISLVQARAPPPAAAAAGDKRKRREEEDSSNSSDEDPTETAKQLRAKAARILDRAQQIEKEEAERRKIKAPFDLVVGAVVRGESQDVYIKNGKAAAADPREWDEDEERIEIGEEWYWGKLTADGPLYLINDDVVGQGHGEITIWRNPVLVSNEPATIPVRQQACSW